MEKKTNFLKIPANRIIALILLDVMDITIASFVALYIRFDFRFKDIYPQYLKSYEHILIPTILMTLLFFAIWKLYKSVWRYASANELINIVMANICASAAQFVLCWITGNSMPRSYSVLYCFFLVLLTCGVRFGYRILRIINNKRMSLAMKNIRSNVMVIGAGAAGDMLLKEIESSSYLELTAK